MPKFKQGETSKSVINRKNAISKSLAHKAKLIDKINYHEDIPKSLEMKSDFISQSLVHKWNDSTLKITRNSRNSAHAEHNKIILETLIKSIERANERLSTNLKMGNQKLTKSIISENEVNKLKTENDELRVALAEVYRCYMQLLEESREDKLVDDSYRRLIRTQAETLGKKRVWSIR
ncbi:hypothetical protein [Pseudoalteromonas sp. NGC95]|uniref:hypothetical protein n=1 Tax=Pseudoalteromonas sp. NGC95 TaxID=2792051 RepID=UPI0018CFBE68|nr:hypothetical protein [Pseudoalteromonas sp. NGC95]MBH0018713.1 hypothetical protein [Pseudoalteromonas sp. NGC95]